MFVMAAHRTVAMDGAVVGLTDASSGSGALRTNGGPVSPSRGRGVPGSRA